MTTEWIELGRLEDFAEGKPTLKKEGDRRFACVRAGDQLHAIDDRCPHQGYPLSQGSVNGCVLTCEWHNWKFDLSSGDCTFGGEPVRRYPTRVEDGRVYLSLFLDASREAARLDAGIRAALAKGDPGRALREGLRLGEHRKDAGVALGGLDAAFAVLAGDGAARAEYGFDHALAVLADLCTWAERGWIAAEEAFTLGAVAVGELSANLAARPVPTGELEAPSDLSRVEADLAAERRSDAELRVRELVRSRGAEAARDALLPYVSRHVFDYGHGAIFLTKALDLAARFPAQAEPILASATVELSWATAETSLPPFTATRGALERLAAMRLAPRGAAFDRRALEAGVLEGERAGLAEVLRALEAGAEPVAILRAVAHAAAVRLSRFDRAWEAKLDAEVGVLDVTHAVTFTEAAIALSSTAAPEIGARFALLAAGFIGKLRKADGAELTFASPTKATLLDAVRERDAASARTIARELDGPGRVAAYAEVAPFAALDAATRPIFYAHTIKNTEALRRLELGDVEADGAYLDALLAYVVPARRERNVRRVAFVAKKFSADGRPPEGLY